MVLQGKTVNEIQHACLTDIMLSVLFDDCKVLGVCCKVTAHRMAFFQWKALLQSAVSGKGIEWILAVHVLFSTLITMQGLAVCSTPQHAATLVPLCCLHSC